MSFRLDVVKEAVEWAEKLEEYGVEATIRLDDKAQQTGGWAGLFLAGALGFARPGGFDSLGPRMKVFAGGMLLAIITLLVACLAACLSVTWLSNAPMPIGLSTLRQLNEDLLGPDDDEPTERVQENYYYDRLSIWEGIVKDRRELNKVKARRVARAQTLLAVGMFLISALLFTVICSMLLWRHAR